MYLLLYYPGIINISSPNPRGCSAVAIALCSKASIKMLAMMGLMGDPRWAIKKIFNHHQNKEKKKTPRRTHPSKCHIVVPYIEGMGESIKKICKKTWSGHTFQGRQDTQKHLGVTKR